MYIQKFFNPFKQTIFYLENFFYQKKDNTFTFLSVLAHILFLLPMVSLSFNEDKIIDVPLILPVEMFIIEDKTSAPEFKQKVNEVIPDMVEQIQEIEKEIIKETDQIEAKEEILASESVEEESNFVIEKKNKT